MNRRSNGFRWRRAIDRDEEQAWQERLAGVVRPGEWLILEKPGRSRLAVEAWFSSRAAAVRLETAWGGRVDPVVPVPPVQAKPVRIGPRIEIIHEGRPGPAQLIIPCGMAFGSGEHATTFMLLRALACRSKWGAEAILDLGTGSGVLALAARFLGAGNVTGSDFDPKAIPVARANEKANFGSRAVAWKVEDATRLGARPRYDLILANLYSGVLIEAAPRLARALSGKGELWLSGVLHEQDREVANAMRRAGLRRIATTRRGRWVMQQWKRAA